MWRNTAVANFIGWMRHHNKKRDAARRAAFYNSSTRSSGPMKRAP
jgi:erythromycin esterase-like protein